MKVKIAAFSAVLGFVLATPGVIAHHSFAAEFDAAKPITLKGIVTKIEWANPHTYFYMDVTDADGKVMNWGMEMGSPNGLMRQGWTRNTRKVGDQVGVRRVEDVCRHINARAVTMAATGKRLFAATSQTETPSR